MNVPNCPGPCFEVVAGHNIGEFLRVPDLSPTRSALCGDVMETSENSAI